MINRRNHSQLEKLIYTGYKYYRVIICYNKFNYKDNIKITNSIYKSIKYYFFSLLGKCGLYRGPGRFSKHYGQPN